MTKLRVSLGGLPCKADRILFLIEPTKHKNIQGLLKDIVAWFGMDQVAEYELRMFDSKIEDIEVIGDGDKLEIIKVSYPKS